MIKCTQECFVAYTPTRTPFTLKHTRSLKQTPKLTTTSLQRKEDLCQGTQGTKELFIIYILIVEVHITHDVPRH